jgi:hypothetical protein
MSIFLRRKNCIKDFTGHRMGIDAELSSWLMTQLRDEHFLGSLCTHMGKYHSAKYQIAMPWVFLVIPHKLKHECSMHSNCILPGPSLKFSTSWFQ